MAVAKVEVCFYILKQIRSELLRWNSKSLNEIKKKDVLEIIKLLNIFLEIKTEIEE